MLRLIVLSLIAICWLQGQAVADDNANNCRALLALNDRYRNVALTSEQKAIKEQLAAWYFANCKKRGGRLKRAG